MAGFAHLIWGDEVWRCQVIRAGARTSLVEADQKTGTCICSRSWIAVTALELTALCSAVKWVRAFAPEAKNGTCQKPTTQTTLEEVSTT